MGIRGPFYHCWPGLTDTVARNNKHWTQWKLLLLKVLAVAVAVAAHMSATALELAPAQVVYWLKVDKVKLIGLEGGWGGMSSSNVCSSYNFEDFI